MYEEPRLKSCSQARCRERFTESGWCYSRLSARIRKRKELIRSWGPLGNLARRSPPEGPKNENGKFNRWFWSFCPRDGGTRVGRGWSPDDMLQVAGSELSWSDMSYEIRITKTSPVSRRVSPMAVCGPGLLGGSEAITILRYDSVHNKFREAIEIIGLDQSPDMAREWSVYSFDDRCS